MSATLGIRIMILSFEAGKVAVEDLDNCWVVGFADNEFTTQRCLIVQRAYQDDDQDIKLGLNT